MYIGQEEQEVPAIFRCYVDDAELSRRKSGHPFGVRIKQYRIIKGLTLEDLQSASGVSSSGISLMCDGTRLKGTKARSNVMRLIHALWLYGVLEYVDQANELLDLAEQHLLEEGTTEEDSYLLARLATRSYQEPGPKVVTVLEEVEIYDGAAQYLLENGSKDVRVYAPLALWQPSLYKKQHWFSVLAKYLSSNLDAQAQMVFGVPHRWDSYEYMKDTLSVFQSLELTGHTSSRKRPSISIHYIPPIRHQEPPPAIGMIVFDSEVVAIGFGVRDAMEKIDTGWVLFDKDAARTAKDWFDCKIWPKYQSYELMRTQPRLKRMNDGFSELEKTYAEQFTEEW